MPDDIMQLSPTQMDALREIGNVGAGNSATALSQIINHRIDMNILVLLPAESAFYLVDMLMGKKRGETQNLDYLDESALMEIGNILAGAYLNALFNLTKLSLLPSIPALAMDMAGAILNVVLIQLGQMGDHALVIETEFTTDEEGIKGHFFLVPDPGSLDTILTAVGV